MPYIKSDRRIALAKNPEPLCKGELNFLITKLLHQYILRTGLSYQNLSDAKGAAQDAAEEFSRVVMGPYEDSKRLENGPVSSLDKVLDDKRAH